MERLINFTEEGRRDFNRWLSAVAPDYDRAECELDALNHFEDAYAEGNSLGYELRVNGRGVEYHASESDFVFEETEKASAG